MFSNNPVGDFSLNVPLDSNGQITLFAFCNGLMPFKVILNSSENIYDISMFPCSGETPPVTTCDNIKGSWSDKVSGTMTTLVNGQGGTLPVSGNRQVSIAQSGCASEWSFTDSGSYYKRTGNIAQKVVTISGDLLNSTWLANSLEDGLSAEGFSNVVVKFTSNSFSGQGTISNGTITAKGTGSMSGTITASNLSKPLTIAISVTENASMTKTSTSLSQTSQYDGEETLSLLNLITESVVELITSSSFE